MDSIPTIQYPVEREVCVSYFFKNVDEMRYWLERHEERPAQLESLFSELEEYFVRISQRHPSIKDYLNECYQGVKELYCI